MGMAALMADQADGEEVAAIVALEVGVGFLMRWTGQCCANQSTSARLGPILTVARTVAYDCIERGDPIRESSGPSR
jgi:hypothetical protein